MSHSFITVGLAICLGLSLLGVVFLWWIDRRDLGSVRTAGITIVFSFLVSAGALIFVDRGGLAPFLNPGNEQVLWLVVQWLISAFAVVLIFSLSGDFEGPIDGWLIGSLSGIGWAMALLIVPLSASAKLLFASGGWQWIISVMILDVFSLSVFAGALGCACVASGKANAFWIAAAGFLLGASLMGGGRIAALHVTTQGFNFLIGGACIGWLGLLVSLFFVESRILRKEIAEETAFGVLPEWAVEIFPLYRKRIGSSWRARLCERRVLNGMVSHLCFRKHALAGKAEALDALEILRLRERLGALFHDEENSESVF